MKASYPKTPAAWLKNFLSQLSYIPRALNLVWAAAPVLTSVWLVLLAVQSVLPIATLYLTKLLVNSLVTDLKSGADLSHFHTTLFFALLMVGILLLNECLRIVFDWIQTSQGELVKDHMTSLLHQKSVALDLAFYDSPDYYDHLHRAREEAGYRPLALLQSLGSFFQNAVTLLGMSLILLHFGFWLPAALVASTLPAFYVVLRSSVREHQWRKASTTEERRSWYYDWLLTSQETAAELRLFGMGRQFTEIYQRIRKQLRTGYLNLVQRQGTGEFAASVIGLGVKGAVMLHMIHQTALGVVSLGDLALFYQAFHQGEGWMRSLLQSAGKIYSNSLFLGNLFSFFDLKAQVADPAHPVSPPTTLREGIHFHEVTFHYPSSGQQPVLQKFNLFIPAGQTIAVVGPNGAGKSTLLKLLCRFYDPQLGRITLDGIDLRDMTMESLHQSLTVLFQEPVHYHAAAGENISLSEKDQEPSDSTAVKWAAQLAGADEFIGNLPRGYSTMLGNWFAGGIQPSVGQWQRIALARAFFRQAPILLLDEPTSAMDSWAETSWLERFQSLAAGRTVVMITHRFTTAMRADMIHVMDEGRILESGSHEELLARQGLYAQSWQAQMKQGVPEYR